LLPIYTVAVFKRCVGLYFIALSNQKPTQSSQQLDIAYTKSAKLSLRQEFIQFAFIIDVDVVGRAGLQVTPYYTS